MSELQLRPAQAKILEYENGRLAISAVPGSGKTFTLSLLAAKLIMNGRIDPNQQQILIVTYLNASVDNFKVRVRQQLEAKELPPIGYEVRTLHSLALEIVRIANSGLGDESGPTVLDEGQGSHFLARAVDGWIEEHPAKWQQFLTDDAPQTRARWRDVTQKSAKAFIRSAKNERYRPQQILEALE
ncbi:MAG: UvrD-helicase domain-containing protein, partial [Chloroflexi bacterium]|nr:UvrD-helicase domain-containing protein [Chloroflexota bacterium]